MATSASKKFRQGEIVLYYDPDPAKDSLVRGCKGWCPECVPEKLLFKNTEENLQFRNKRYLESVHEMCRHEYRSQCDKNNVRTDVKSSNPELPKDSANEIHQIKNKNVPVPNDLKLLPRRKLPELDFPENLKCHVQYSCFVAYSDNQLVQLPCQPNVVMLFENYLKYLARTNFSNCSLLRTLSEKDCYAHKVFDKTQIEKHYNICVEILDGLRICFNNFLFKNLLVNKSEQAQYHEAIKMFLKPPVIDILSHNGGKPKLQDNVPNNEEKDHLQIEQDFALGIASRYAPSRKTRSSIKLIQSTITSNAYVSKADTWKAVPNSVYSEEIKQPAVIYGIHHLLRFLDKLPKIFELIPVEDEKLLAIHSFSNELLRYLSTQTHLFEEQYFINAERFNEIEK